jgi:hypothetical protein
MEKLLGIDRHSMFVPGDSPAEIVVRGTLIYFFCFAVLRVLRRGVGQLGIADVLIVVLIADAAQNGMSNDYKSVTEGVALAALFICKIDFLFHLCDNFANETQEIFFSAADRRSRFSRRQGALQLRSLPAEYCL